MKQIAKLSHETDPTYSISTQIETESEEKNEKKRIIEEDEARERERFITSFFVLHSFVDAA